MVKNLKQPRYFFIFGRHSLLALAEAWRFFTHLASSAPPDSERQGGVKKSLLSNVRRTNQGAGLTYSQIASVRIEYFQDNAAIISFTSSVAAGQDNNNSDKIKPLDYHSKSYRQSLGVKFTIGDKIIEQSLNNLGGLVKAGFILKQTAYENLIEDIVSYLITAFTAPGKQTFALSVYNNQNRKLTKRQLKLFSQAVKKKLKEQGINSRFILSPDINLTSAAVKYNNLLANSGRELVLLLTQKKKIWLGVTLGVQKFSDFSQRDYGRPQRSMSEIGLMPPKLARIMVNLAGLKNKDQLLDPFCGAGTILQEALLLGFKEVIGSDLSSKALQAAADNLSWLTAHYKFPGKYSLIRADARQLTNKFRSETIKAIVTEPYLGPLRMKGGDLSSLINIIRKLESLLFAAFKAFRKILKIQAPVVMIWPVFTLPQIKPGKGEQLKNFLKPRRRGNKIFLDLVDKVAGLGFQRVDYDSLLRAVLPPSLREKQILARADLTYRRTFLYSRPGQKVKREILVWRWSGRSY